MRLLVPATLAGAMVCGLAAAAPAQASNIGSRNSAPNVFVVGDSLTVGSSPYLKADLRQGFANTRVDARVGRHTGEGVSRLHLGRNASIWVVALGTNDGPSPSAMRTYVRNTLRRAGARPVLWVSIWRSPAYGRVNRLLSRMDRSSTQLSVLRWDSYIRDHRGLLAGDGVHLSATGYRVRARMIAAEVRRIAAENGFSPAAPGR